METGRSMLTFRPIRPNTFATWTWDTRVEDSTCIQKESARISSYESSRSSHPPSLPSFPPYKKSIPLRSAFVELTEGIERRSVNLNGIDVTKLSMDGRFFGIPRSSRQPPAYCYSVPVHRQPPACSPKVVSIPVHFVGPEPVRIRPGTRSRAESAVRIQAAFRGFVVRKYVKKLDVVRREVEEIERRVCEEESAELIRRDEKERLRVSEFLMSLLFRLDSVRGVDAGVRELRKKVIKKAIALQEKVDAIAAAADMADQKEGGAGEVEQSEEGGADSPDLPDQEKNCSESEQTEERDAGLPDLEEVGDVAAQSEEPVSKDRDIEDDGAEDAKLIKDEVTNGLSEGLVANTPNDDREHGMEMEPAASESSGESRSDPSLYPEGFLEEVEENAPVKTEDEAPHAKSFEEKGEEEADVENVWRTDNRSEEMLERMVEDNEKMMGMMMQLFERNERQTQLLSMLSQRVERLEKAFLCEKLRRKKKREATEGNRLPNSNKCGKK